jgi:hypothetical protein
MGTRGIIVLRIANQVVLKIMVSYDMHLCGTINEIVVLIIALIQTKQVTDPNALVPHIFKAAQTHVAAIPPLDHSLKVAALWPFWEHTYFIDLDTLRFEHIELAGRYHKPMNLDQFIAHAEIDVCSVAFDPVAYLRNEPFPEQDSHNWEYVRFVGRDGNSTSSRGDDGCGQRPSRYAREV